jgi:molybdate transport system substrate-binding protein
MKIGCFRKGSAGGYIGNLHPIVLPLQHECHRNSFPAPYLTVPPVGVLSLFMNALSSRSLFRIAIIQPMLAHVGFRLSAPSRLLVMWRQTLIGIALSVATAASVAGKDLVVMTSGAFTASHLELALPFELKTGYTIVTATTTMGVGNDSIPNRLKRRERADVVIVAGEALDDLIRDGSVVPGSRVDLVKSNIGMAVRAGAPRPNIQSVSALIRTLLAAKSIAYSASVSGDYLANELFPRLGISEQIKPKCMRIEHERVGAVVARGEAEIGFQMISELLPIQGIDYVGPLPGSTQKTTVFSAGIATHANDPEGARTYIRFLKAPEVEVTIRKSGLEPVR